MSAAAADRQTVDAIVELVKNQGLFDKFRRDCLNDVESNETYQQLKERVESHAERQLRGKEEKFGLNKNQLREEFRREVTWNADKYRQSIVRLVDQLISPEIRDQIQLAVEERAKEHLGIPNSNQQDSIDFPSGSHLQPSIDSGKMSHWAAAVVRNSHSSTPVQDELSEGRETAVTPNPTRLSPIDTAVDMDIDDNNSDSGPSLSGKIEYFGREPRGDEETESDEEKLEEIETSTVAEYVAVDDEVVEESQYIDETELIQLPSGSASNPLGCFILEPICSDMSEGEVTTDDETITSAAELHERLKNKSDQHSDVQSDSSS